MMYLNFIQEESFAHLTIVNLCSLAQSYYNVQRVHPKTLHLFKIVASLQN